MVFASLEFLTLFLPLFLALYALAPKRARNGVLMLGSWIFYGWWSPYFLLLLIALTVLGWLGGMAIERIDTRRPRVALLALLIAVNASILFWYKYANILVEMLNEALAWSGAMPLSWQRLVLPAGLSFVVLQAISYLVDVHRGTVRAQRSFIDYAAYKAMFGQLIAGPIIRYDWVARELADRPFDRQGFVLGARRFMIGMSMKVLVADTLAPVVDAAFALPQPTLADAWIGCAAYTLQLFFDFAGYSAMAIGLGLMMGFRFPENFNHPYLAVSIQDFWRRWHLSLSTWIRDYLYIPMGGNRLGVYKTYRNLLLTMAIAGLWHGGDSWNFLLWGLAHGLALAVARAWTQAGWLSLPRLVSRLLTLLFVMLAWTLFRAAGFDNALTMYQGQFGLNGIALGETLSVMLRPAHLLAALLGLACVMFPLWHPWLARLRPGPALTWLAGLWPLAGFVLSYSLIASRGAVPFLYFQF